MELSPEVPPSFFPSERTGERSPFSLFSLGKKKNSGGEEGKRRLGLKEKNLLPREVPSPLSPFSSFGREFSLSQLFSSPSLLSFSPFLQREGRGRGPSSGKPSFPSPPRKEISRGSGGKRKKERKKRLRKKNKKLHRHGD